MACIETLVNKYDVDIHIVRKLANKEAPFDLGNLSNSITLYNSNNFNYKSLKSLAVKANPSLLFCGGWSDKRYLKLANYFKNSIPTVIGFDNKWEGNLKQRILLTLGKIMVKPKFRFAFVPGEAQKKFALKLGFKSENVILGAYSADVNHFAEIYNKNKQEPLDATNHFLYIGRYVKHKGIFELWNAFIELQNETPNNWELWCIGTGDEEPNKLTHPKIKHFGFVQPKDMGNYLKPNGVYILPSHFEPWGVSVHEMAAAGYPMILSEEVGAKEVFLNKNGFKTTAKSKESIKRAMKKMIALSQEERNQLAINSKNLSTLITPDLWSEKIINMIQS
jgi:glycosyltransferase involved in cell wall biosynthesis